MERDYNKKALLTLSIIYGLTEVIFGRLLKDILAVEILGEIILEGLILLMSVGLVKSRGGTFKDYVANAKSLNFSAIFIVSFFAITRLFIRSLFKPKGAGPSLLLEEGLALLIGLIELLLDGLGAFFYYFWAEKEGKRLWEFFREAFFFGKKEFKNTLGLFARHRVRPYLIYLLGLGLAYLIFEGGRGFTISYELLTVLLFLHHLEVRPKILGKLSSTYLDRED